MQVMRLERLELTNFRSYKKKTFKLGQLVLLVGPNGAGKTNALEAIYLLSTGGSPRAEVTEEMIQWGEEIAQVSGVAREEKKEQYQALAVVLTPGRYLGKPTTKRRYLVDGAGRTRANFAGRLPAGWFRPEDLRLIEGSPYRRRQYLDEVLSQASPEYGRALTAYERGLRRRNRVLAAIKEREAKREQLKFWDQTIIKNGEVLTQNRREYLESLIQVETAFGRYRAEYKASTISEERLMQYAEAEVAAGYTLVGPHKDDFGVMQEQGREKDLHTYGSRGEQRLGVLFLKLGNWQYLEEHLKTRPILLLDDIFSELDQAHREEVLLVTGGQTIITATEEGQVKGAQVEHLG